jgi:hypothetical protein
MECPTGTSLQQRLAHAELELRMAVQNFRCTGLPRYKKIIPVCEAELRELQQRVTEHESHCDVCSQAMKLHSLLQA